MMAQFPSKEIAQLSYDFRTLGLGYANIGGLLTLVTYLVPALNTVKPFKLISYIVIGHLANFIGGMKYLLGTLLLRHL